MSYTSEQYKYLLFRRLQRHFAMTNDVDRAYTQSFFGKLFDETITVTEEAYNKFAKLMDDEMQFCANKGINSDDDITEDMIEEHGLLLTETFAAIDIDLVVSVTKTSDGYMTGGDATFTKPNGDVMVYSVRGGWYASNQNRFYICAQSRTEYEYAKVSAKYYNFKDHSPIGLDIHNPFRAGYDTFWSYDAETAIMTITGKGTYVSAPTDPQVGGGPYTTLILGSNVSRIASGALDSLTLSNLVLLHATDLALLLADDIVSASSNIWYLNAYCDNMFFKNHQGFPPGLIINWYALDEWEGGSNIPELRGVEYSNVFLPEFRNIKSASYPYTCICVDTEGNYVVLPSRSAKSFAEGAITLEINTSYTSYWLKKEDAWGWLWTTGIKTVAPIWANYDILNSDGTVGLAASAPVKDGVPLNIIAYSYKGAELDYIPDWDTSTYPNATMVKGEEGIYYLYYSVSKAYSSSGTLLANVKFTLSGKMLVYKIDTSNDEGWVYVNSYSSNSVSIARANLQWANYALTYSYVNTAGTAYTGTQVYAAQTVPAKVYG